MKVYILNLKLLYLEMLQSNFVIVKILMEHKNKQISAIVLKKISITMDAKILILNKKLVHFLNGLITIQILKSVIV